MSFFAEERSKKYPLIPLIKLEKIKNSFLILNSSTKFFNCRKNY